MESRLCAAQNARQDTVSSRHSRQLRAAVSRKRCRCGAPGLWDDTTDIQTGTAYLRCRRCGAHYLASPRGYVDWGTGLFVTSPDAVGSAWTQHVSANAFPSIKTEHT